MSASIVQAEQVEMELNAGASTTPPSSSVNGHRQHQSQFKPLRCSQLLLLNITLMVLGIAGAPLLLRLYFLHGGKRLWLSTFIQVSASPLLLLPMSLSYLRRRRRSSSDGGSAKLVHLTLPLAAACLGVGLLNGLCCYLNATGSSYLPLSTSNLISSAQLAFTAVAALLVVRQRFTQYSVNAVVLLTLGPVVLSLHAGGDRPEGETRAHYYLGFLMTVVGAGVSGGLMPLIELIYERSRQAVTYAMVMEMQFVLGTAGLGFSLVGMLLNNDFQAISREARDFGLGEVKYYVVLVLDAIFWQLVNVGLIGVISGASSLLAGVLSAALLPVSELLSVIFLHEKFGGSKGVALALSLWGFTSYLYGERKQSKKAEKAGDQVQPCTSVIP